MTSSWRPSFSFRIPTASWSRAVGSPASVQRASTSALTVVSAPAGFGKTTLLAQLAGGLDEERGGHAVAWVSLDERDGDPRRFWSYLLHAVERASPGAAASALDLLDSATGSLEGVIVALVNELSVHPGEVTLVLDDYHLVDDPAISDDVAFLLDHRPPHLHLVIGTRADPALPLARLRAQGELVEVRANDLRFTADEAAAYLNGVHSLDLSAADVSSLESRTEGWIAALQLAAASLHGRDDKTAFISGFAGDDRFVVDYLADEVLDRQPAALRRFLLETSVLERLSGPLCDAVTDQEDGASTLVALERKNLLIVPLDDRRQLVPVPPPVRRCPSLPAGHRGVHRRQRLAPARQRVVRAGGRDGCGGSALGGGRGSGPGRRPRRDRRPRSASATKRGRDPRVDRRHPRRRRASAAGAGGDLHRGVDGRQRVRWGGAATGRPGGGAGRTR